MPLDIGTLQTDQLDIGAIESEPLATQRGNIDYDQIKVVARHGNGSQLQMFGGGATVAGNVAVFDAGGNVIDGGAGGGGGMTITVDGVPI
jgi:hypothetical protein